MSYEDIDLTTAQPNGKQGEPSTTAWGKAKRMFTELYKGRTTTADRLHYFGTDGADGFTPFTQAGRDLLDDADAAAMLVTLGLGAPSGVGKNILTATDAAKVRELIGLIIAGSGRWVNAIPYIGADGTMDICKRLDWHEDGAETKDYSARMESGGGDPYWLWPGTNRGLKMYHQGNSVGPVGANSAGFPTGSVMERGGNSTSNYIRFADGTQICWGTIGWFSRTSESAGAGFHVGVGDAAFPVSFADTPLVSYGLSFRGDSGYYGMPAINSPATSQKTGTIYIWSPNNSCIAQATYIAIGRWQ